MGTLAIGKLTADLSTVNRQQSTVNRQPSTNPLTKSSMISEKFRRQLRQEALLWKAENLISDSLYQQLAERYQFNTIEAAASSRFIMILIGLGGILLGLGIITFVAANWQEWSRELKMFLLLGLFIAVSTTGFYLWRQPPSQQFNAGKKRRLGEGLLICGALSLGANISLMAQMFHLGGDTYQLFYVWALGVLSMAVGLQLTSLGILGVILLGIGYSFGAYQLYTPDDFSIPRLLLEHTALLTGFVVIPLAYWCKSRAIFILSLLLLIPALEVSLSPLLTFDVYPGLWLAIALTFVPALLWGYDDALFPKVDGRLFRPLARNLAILALASLFYFLSFHGVWETLSFSSSDSDFFVNSWLLLDFVIFFGLTILQWIELAKPSKLYPKRWGLDSVSSVIAVFLGVTAVVSFWHLQVNSIPALATFIFNVQMFLLGGGLVRVGLAEGKRFAFWGGMVLLVLHIMSRMFEYNTELILKAFVFILCGVGVILAGLWFERHLQKEGIGNGEQNTVFK